MIISTIQGITLYLSKSITIHIYHHSRSYKNLYAMVSKSVFLCSKFMNNCGYIKFCQGDAYSYHLPHFSGTLHDQTQLTQSFT